MTFLDLPKTSKGFTALKPITIQVDGSATPPRKIARLENDSYVSASRSMSQKEGRSDTPTVLEGWIDRSVPLHLGLAEILADVSRSSICSTESASEERTVRIFSNKLYQSLMDIGAVAISHSWCSQIWSFPTPKLPFAFDQVSMTGSRQSVSLSKSLCFLSSFSICLFIFIDKTISLVLPSVLWSPTFQHTPNTYLFSKLTTWT